MCAVEEGNGRRDGLIALVAAVALGGLGAPSLLCGGNSTVAFPCANG